MLLCYYAKNLLKLFDLPCSQCMKLCLDSMSLAWDSSHPWDSSLGQVGQLSPCAADRRTRQVQLRYWSITSGNI